MDPEDAAPSLVRDQHYRHRAAQARRLARGITDAETVERLNGLARQYDAIAERIKQLDNEKQPALPAHFLGESAT